MDYEYLNKEINRHEEFWDKEFNKKKAVGKAQKWHWEGLNDGFKFAMQTARDIIKHGEELDNLIGRLKRLNPCKSEAIHKEPPTAGEINFFTGEFRDLASKRMISEFEKACSDNNIADEMGAWLNATPSQRLGALEALKRNAKIEVLEEIKKDLKKRIDGFGSFFEQVTGEFIEKEIQKKSKWEIIKLWERIHDKLRELKGEKE